MRALAKKLILASVLLTAIFVCSGCSTLMNMLKPKPSPNAIRAKKREERAKKEEAAYQVIAAKTGCDGVLEGYKKAYGAAVKNKERRKKTAVHLAKCGHWDMVFLRMGRSNQRWVNDAYGAIAAAKLPIHKEFNKWLSRANRPYEYMFGSRIAFWTLDWFAKADNPKQHCEAYWNNLDRLSASKYRNAPWQIRGVLIGYLYRAKCTHMKPKIVGLLTSNSWRDRNQACAFLKDWGTKADLGRLRALAMTDPQFYINRRVRIYPVRDTCRSAIGRINMRN